VTPTNPNLASAITKTASKQTYYMIRLLVDRPRMEDAYRAYAYFRWVDDVLDAEDGGQVDRGRFLDRQKALLEQCLRGEAPRNAGPHEAMLIELLRHFDGSDRGLETYLRQMMLVMEFDESRRGRLVSEAELTGYTRSLAIAVTEAMQHFLGSDTEESSDETRYLAASGAHILHMLRDTFADLRAGYINVPRELLAANSIGPENVHTDAYRGWVERRVRLARAYLDAGRSYFARVPDLAHRLAALGYIARFEWLIETLEREDFDLRPRYDERRSLVTGVRMTWQVISWLTGFRGRGSGPRPIASRPDGQA